MESASPKSVVVWVSDLIFETKIRSTAQSLGVALSTVRSMAALATELDRALPSLMIVDLNASGADPIEVVVAVKSHAARPCVLAYVSHVDADLAQRAQAAGADEVLARSRFTMELPRILGTM